MTKLTLQILFIFLSFSTIAQVAESKVGFKKSNWKQFDALVLNNGKLLSWEQHGKESFVRLYKEDLKLENSFKVADDKKFLKSKTTRIIDFAGKQYLVYDNPVLNEKVHELFAQEINFEERHLEDKKIKIATFKTNNLVKGYFEIQSKDERRILVSYHERITYDYNQKLYINLLNEKLESVNERLYTFEHKWNLFRKIKYLVLPNDDVLVYGELFKSKVYASSDELRKLGESEYLLLKLALSKANDKSKVFGLDDLFISDLFLKVKEENVIVAGTYSSYSNLHNQGVFYVVWSLGLETVQPTQKVDLKDEMCENINKAFYRYRKTDDFPLQANGASFYLQEVIKSKYKQFKGLYSYEILDVEEIEGELRVLMTQNYKYSIQHASMNKVNSVLMSDQKNNFLEGNIVYLKLKKDANSTYQIIERFNVTKSKENYIKPSVFVSQNNKEELLFFFGVGRLSLMSRAKDDYNFSQLADIRYVNEYYKRGDKVYYNTSKLMFYSNKKEGKYIKMIRIY